jgi:uncharacterized protein YeaO (DUF488 family)
MPVAVKRVYEEPSREDGTRALIDRLWPRGLSKDRAQVHTWLPELAPSNELRKWFHTHRQAWPEFRKRYLKELTRPDAAEALEKLHDLAAGTKRITLLFASKDENHNNAVVLKELLEGMRKPPTGTGPGAIGAARIRQAAKRPRG